LVSDFASLDPAPSPSSIRTPDTLEPHQIHHTHFTRFRRTLGAMDPQLKVILDEIQKSKEDFNRRFDAHDE